MLFVLFNPYTKRIRVVDEIYEQNPAEMTAVKIWEKVIPICEEYKRLGVREFRYVYDEAAAWFDNESSEAAPGRWLEPTSKSKADKESGLSLFRDIIHRGLLEVAAECVHFISECENYVKDQNGRIPKKLDHLIDCFRYFLDAAGFEFQKKEFPVSEDPDMKPRFKRIEDEFLGSNNYSEID